jgi:MFS family permease
VSSANASGRCPVCTVSRSRASLRALAGGDSCFHDGVPRFRVATALAFLLFGTALGAWTARIPAIKHDLGLTDGKLSLALLAFAAGAIAGMQVTGRLVDRLGASTVLFPLAVLEAAGLISTALAPALWVLAVALFGFGLVHGGLNIAMNANGVEVQREMGRPVITSFHATYSIGGFLGALLGGLFAYWNATPLVTFVWVGLLVVLLAVWCRLWLLPSPPTPVVVSGDPSGPSRSSGAGSSGAGRVSGVLFLGVLAFCCLVGEGAAADWSTVYVRDSLGGTPGFAAAAYGAFALAMMGGRMVGDRLAARFGAVDLVRYSALLAAFGLVLAVAVAVPWSGVVGFGCLGAGLACIAPQVFSAAGNRNPARAGQALARVAGMGYAGFLVGPVVIGALAEISSLRWALIVPVVLTGFVALSAVALSTPRVPAPSALSPR